MTADREVVVVFVTGPDRETMVYDPVGQQIFCTTGGQSLRLQ